MIYNKSLILYDLMNTSPKGLMPVFQLVQIAEEYYGERVVGVTRQYAAAGADKRIDKLVRIWRNDEALPNRYAVLEDGNQYRIDFAQELLDEDGLEVTDLTLVKLEENYDISTK